MEELKQELDKFISELNIKSVGKYDLSEETLSQVKANYKQMWRRNSNEN